MGSGKYYSGPVTRSFKMGFGKYAHKTVRDLLDEFWPDALERLKRAVERDHPKEKAQGA